MHGCVPQKEIVRRSKELHPVIMNRSISKMRSTAVKATAKLFEFMTHDPLKAQAERYVSESGDLHELEFRQRQVDRGMFSRRHR
jgi:hypothetical protein